MLKHLLTKSSLLLCTLIAGSASAWGEEELYYTLDGSITTGGNNAYADDGGGLTQNGIEWSVTGNTTMNPWRIGGNNLSNTNRNVYSKTAMGAAITKVELEIGEASSVTVNSLKLISVLRQREQRKRPALTRPQPQRLGRRGGIISRGTEHYI